MVRSTVRDIASAVLLLAVAAVAGEIDAGMLAHHAADATARAALVVGALTVLAVGSAAAARAIAILLVHGLEARRRLARR